MVCAAAPTQQLQGRQPTEQHLVALGKVVGISVVELLGGVQFCMIITHAFARTPMILLSRPSVSTVDDTITGLLASWAHPRAVT